MVLFPIAAVTFLEHTALSPVLGHMQPLIRRLQGAEADHSLQTSAEDESIQLYLHSPIRLHDVVFNKGHGQL